MMQPVNVRTVVYKTQKFHSKSAQALKLITMDFTIQVDTLLKRLLFLEQGFIQQSSLAVVEKRSV